MQQQFENKDGISESNRLAIANTLNHLLGDTFSLYTTLLNYHWNVIGPTFGPLHSFFDELAGETKEYADILAERIRSLGFRTQASFESFKSECVNTESANAVVSPNAMLINLLKDNESIIVCLRESYPLTEQARDISTSDMFVQQIRFHEKAAWKLRALLKQVNDSSNQLL